MPRLDLTAAPSGLAIFSIDGVLSLYPANASLTKKAGLLKISQGVTKGTFTNLFKLMGSIQPWNLRTSVGDI
jgi:hypothetical protein